MILGDPREWASIILDLLEGTSVVMVVFLGGAGGCP